MNDNAWMGWIRPLVLAALPAATAGLVAWGATQAKVADLRDDIAKLEVRDETLGVQIRDLDRASQIRAGDSRVLQTSLAAIEHRLARIEARLYGEP